MKVVSVVTMAAVAVASSCAGEVAPETEREIVVCMALGDHLLVQEAAKRIAGSMFAEAGVKIKWQGNHACSPFAIRISFSERNSPEFLPGAFAYALPYEGTHIMVLYDRLQERLERGQLPNLLAHVLVHEITHILQGSIRHSESGVMKAVWIRADFNEMAFKPLPFTPTDVWLIHLGLDARESHRTAANPTSLSVVVP